MKELSQESQGYLYAGCTFLFWGLVPIYFKMVAQINPLEVLTHRIIWSVIVLYAILLYKRQIGAFKHLITDISILKYLLLSALLISINWLVFIWAVSAGKIAESSLGYYINPLVNFALGMLFFKERPTLWQGVAMSLAFISILYQVVALGEFPLIALMLAFSFAFYGLIRKKINLPSTTGLLMETLILLPLALGYFSYLLFTQTNAFVTPFNGTSWLLMLSGLITVIPLLWFNTAATKISLMHLGFFQYIAPTVSFLLAIFVYNEPLLKEKLISFILIWIALLLFSVDAYWKKRQKGA